MSRRNIAAMLPALAVKILAQDSVLAK